MRRIGKMKNNKMRAGSDQYKQIVGSRYASGLVDYRQQVATREVAVGL